jgi:hypothetical protein
MPYSKQIIRGLNRNNQRAIVAVSNKTDEDGHGSIVLKVLKPGTKYSLFVAFTTNNIYQPILYS